MRRDGVDMSGATIEHGKARIDIIERQSKVRSREKHGMGALLLDQGAAGVEEDGSLLLSAARR